MQGAQGVFTAANWKPTWKRPADEYHHQIPNSNEVTSGRYYVTDTASHSTSPSPPTEMSGEESPSILMLQKTSLPAQFHKNSQMSLASGSANNGASPSFAYHHNLFPVDCTGVRQECQTPLQMSSTPDVVCASRLYSTLGDGITHFPSNQHQHGNLQLDHLHRASPASSNGQILVPHPALTPLSTSMAENRSFGASTAVHSNNHNFTRYRTSDGDASFDLTVTNIDSNLGDWKTIRSALTASFSEHVSVRGIWVYSSNDGSTSAVVRLCNKEDAHYAVAQLHRRKIGNKRIFISFDHGQAVDHETLKKEVASLLQDVPNHTLPLFKFREMFERRYKRSVSSSDLYRMKDVVLIAEGPAGGNGISTPSSGRTISLTVDWQNRDGKGLTLYCKLHPPQIGKKFRMGWAEREADVLLPNVIIEIKTLASRMHSLLQSHEGGLPLISFLDCYESEFGTLERATEGRGVPLEHLIACLQGVDIVFAENGMKRVQWHEKKENDQGMSSQPLALQLSQFARELTDLLKTMPKCTLPFAKLIPSYHAHFGRQCRVADYGHFNLSALLHALPHVVQIMGAAQNRVITLSHRAQMKRFSSDLSRVLKSPQGGPKKQIKMDDFPTIFASVFPQRQFAPEDYGLCYFSDLVTELVEHSTSVALIKDEEGNTMLAVPKREQTAQEIHRTRLFAGEVVELLRHSTRCELEFAKFVPYYHHHFQKQCRVADYGFGKLAELFDAISDIVTIIYPTYKVSPSEDKVIRLTPKEQLKVVGEQLCAIVDDRRRRDLTTSVQEMIDCFMEEHGFSIKPELCGADDLDDLVLNKLENYLQVDERTGEVIPVDRLQIEDIAHKAEAILHDCPDYQISMDELIRVLNEKCENPIDEATIEKDLNHIVVISDPVDGEPRNVTLAPLRVFAHEMVQLLEAHNGSIFVCNLEHLYLQHFGRPVRPALLGCPSVLTMLLAIPDVLCFKGKQRTRRTIVLRSSAMSTEFSSNDTEDSLHLKTPARGGSYKENRPQSGSKSQGKIFGKHRGEWMSSPRRSRVAPPPLLFSPINNASPYPQQGPAGTVFNFDHPTPLSPQMYDAVWLHDGVAGTPPLSPPYVWTCHPVYYPSSPSPGGPGNIQLVPSTYVSSAPWSPPPVASACFDRLGHPQPTIIHGNDFLFGQNRLTPSFERLTVDGGNEA